MEKRHTAWLVMGGGGIAICAALASWMMPNTTPHDIGSPLAGMAHLAAAQKGTYEPIPASLIPTWQPPAPPPSAARPAPAASEPTVAPGDPASAGPWRNAALSGSPADDGGTDGDIMPARVPAQVADVPPEASAAAPRPAPAPRSDPASDYAQARAAWQAKTAAYRQDSPATDGSPADY